MLERSITLAFMLHVPVSDERHTGTGSRPGRKSAGESN